MGLVLAGDRIKNEFFFGMRMESFLVQRFPYLSVQKQRGRRIPTDAPGFRGPDELLLSRLCTGDHEALALLFARYATVIRGIARRILRDEAEAQDLLQDLFLTIQQKCSSFDSSKGSAGSWLVHMAYQRAIDRKRHLTRRHFYRGEDVRDSLSYMVGVATTENDYSPEAVFGRNGLEKVLSSLSDDQRETLRLFFFEGYTLSEISAKIGQSLANVRNHYYRGLDRIRKQMAAGKTERE